MAKLSLFSPLIALLLLQSFISTIDSTTFTLVNKCDYTIWPGILSNAGIPSLSTTGFALQKGETRPITAPPSWGGRLWARTHCTQDSTNKFTCATGDCGTGTLECTGSGAAPPATLAEFTLNGYDGLDFYDVSLVDGYNLAMLVVPQGGTGNNCTATGCVSDLNESCPSELKVSSVDGKGTVACKSACEKFGEAEYCCSGAYGSPDTCKPSTYSKVFKNACPRAYSYAYDDKSSTFTCAGAKDYLITFCPSPNTSQKTSQGSNTDGGTSTPTPTTHVDPQQDNTMIYQGGFDISNASPSTCKHVFESHGIEGLVRTMSFLFSVLSLLGQLV